MSKGSFTGPLEQVDPCCWRIPKSYRPGMRVDGLIFANDKLMKQLVRDQAPEQVANVAFLPGIQTASMAMPDIHWGYGSASAASPRPTPPRAASSRPAASATTSTAASALCGQTSPTAT